MTDAWIGPRALADAGGVSTSTLRHYERLGLLPPAGRTHAGYRRYLPGALDRVRLIQRALVIGFSLKDLAAVLHRRDQGAVPCQQVRALVGKRLAGLEQRLQDLAALREEMQVLLNEWDERLATTPAGRPARLLDMLELHPSLDGPARALVSGTSSPPVRSEQGRRLAVEQAGTDRRR